MRTQLYCNCPKCGEVTRLKLTFINNGSTEIDPSFKCRCGADVKMKIKMDMVFEPGGNTVDNIHTSNCINNE